MMPCRTDRSLPLSGQSPWEFHQADVGLMKGYLGKWMQSSLHLLIIARGNDHYFLLFHLVQEELDGIRSQP